MRILTNKKHFLHEHLTFIESVGINGKDGGFNKFLTDLGISNKGENWEIDHSTIDWNKSENHYQFFFDYENNELEIMDWLKKSELSKSEFLYTWLDWNDPIVKVKTADFIQNWNEFYIASVEGMILTTIDGKNFMEFTDDWKYHLNSNFEIKPNTKK
jgi:hypothetical protein